MNKHSFITHLAAALLIALVSGCITKGRGERGLVGQKTSGTFEELREDIKSVASVIGSVEPTVLTDKEAEALSEETKQGVSQIGEANYPQIDLNVKAALRQIKKQSQ